MFVYDVPHEYNAQGAQSLVKKKKPNQTCMTHALYMDTLTKKVLVIR